MSHTATAEVEVSTSFIFHLTLYIGYASSFTITKVSAFTIVSKNITGFSQRILFVG